MPSKKIFLASSSELKEDRQAFEIFINRKNKEWQDKGIFLDLIVWENFLDAVSPTRLQDEYNKAIKESDIFIMLFFTKVGKYTNEEFETAFGQFKALNKPLIFTYFKDANISTGNINKDIISLLNFQEKLTELGHFYTKYKNVEELQLNFSQQLDVLVANGLLIFNINSPENILNKELTDVIPRTHPDDIVGREGDLEQLHQLLTQDKHVVVVNGLGGIGKTTLVQGYVFKYYEAYHHLVWVTQSSADVAKDFINDGGLMKNLALDTTNIDPAELFNEILRKLKSIREKPNLLVIDNAEESISNYLDKLPGQPQWHLLVTSREAITGFHPQPLGFLSEEQAVMLFRKYCPLQKLSETDIKELLTVVDYHTLTIEILAKTATEQRYELPVLKQAIEEDLRADIKGVKHNRKQGRIEKVGTYLRALFNLSQLNETELWLMKQLACLPAVFISYELLHELIIGESDDHAAMFSETLAQITRKGWLLQNMDTDNYKMHQVIADVVRKETAIKITETSTLISTISQKLMIDEVKDNPVEKFVWIPFGKAILNNFLESESEEISMLQSYLGLVLRDLGDYTGAKELLEKAISSNEKNFGLNHQFTAGSYSNLGLVLMDLGDYTGAKELLEKAISSNEKNFGLNHQFTARSYSNLGLVLNDLGDYTGAKKLLENAHSFMVKNFGPNHPSTAESYSNLGLVLKDLGDDTGAKEMLEKALSSNEKNFGQLHPSTARSYTNLGFVLNNLGDYSGAKELLEKAISSYVKIFGPHHHSTARSYSILGLALRDLGDYTGAKEMIEKALSLNEKNFGLHHPSTAGSYTYLGSVLQHLGDYTGALKYSEMALTIFKKVYPEGHPYIKIVEEYCVYYKNLIN